MRLAMTILILFGVAYVMFYLLYNADKLHDNFSIVTGRVTGFSGDYKGSGGVVHYEYITSSRKNSVGRKYPNIHSKSGMVLVGDSFPVAYEVGNPSNSRMLITPRDFESFSIQFPDSLTWVKEISH